MNFNTYYNLLIFFIKDILDINIIHFDKKTLYLNLEELEDICIT